MVTNHESGSCLHCPNHELADSLYSPGYVNGNFMCQQQMYCNSATNSTKCLCFTFVISISTMYPSHVCMDLLHNILLTILYVRSEDLTQ